MAKKFSILFGAAILLLAAAGGAEVKNYTGVGKCIMSELVTIEQAKNYAKTRAEMNAKEQAGVYLAEYVRVQNFQLAENEISAITNNITNIVGEVEYTQKPFEQDGTPAILYTATLQANIDTDGINSYLQRDAQDKQNIITQNEAAQRDLKESLNQIDTLNERYTKAATTEERDKIRVEFNQAEKIFLDAQKLNLDNMLVFQSTYKITIEINDSPPSANTAAVPAEDLQKYQSAIADYTKAIEANPNDVEAYNNRGVSYIGLRDFERAVADYNKALELKPDYAEAYNNRGVAYNDLKDFERAVADYNKALELKPDYAEAYNNRGVAYGDLKDFERAVADYNKALELKPDYAEAYNNRGVAYGDLKDYARAVADFDKALELNPNYARAYNNRGVCYREMGEAAKAEADFAKARELGYSG